MSSVKIALIDTGVDLYDDEIKKYIKFDINIQVNNFESIYKSIEDVNGHGTLCAKTIVRICKDVEIYPIRVFDDKGQTSSWRLVEVLNKLLNTDIKIINISASSLNCPCIDELSIVCKELYEEGKIIVCSQHNAENTIISFPTRLDRVIGVKGLDDISNDKDFIYNHSTEIQMYCNSKFHFMRFKNSITEFGKNSRAAAVASGIIANLVKTDINITPKQLEDKLIKRSVNDINKLNRFRIKKTSYSLYETKIVLKLVDIINKNFSYIQINCNLLKQFDLFNNLTNIGRYNAYKFLTIINKEFSINLNYNEVILDELKYLDNTVHIIKGKLSENLN